MDDCSPALRRESRGDMYEMTDPFWDLLEACWDSPPRRPEIREIVDALDYYAQTMRLSWYAYLISILFHLYKTTPEIFLHHVSISRSSRKSSHLSLVERSHHNWESDCEFYIKSRTWPAALRLCDEGMASASWPAIRFGGSSYRRRWPLRSKKKSMHPMPRGPLRLKEDYARGVARNTCRQDRETAAILIGSF